MPRMIPVAPVPIPMLKALSAPFLRFSANAGKMFPTLNYSLKQAEFNLNDKEYVAIIYFLVIAYTLLVGIITTVLLSKMTENFLLFGAVTGLFVGMMVFIQLIMYPQLLMRKRVKAVEKNLVFALRAILVQIKSGVSLFDSMNMVARGEYGEISEEFQKAIDEINTGTPEQEALEEMGERNPSPYLRKALWQIVNGMNAGADISDVLGETVRSMIREQNLAINKYGSQLRVLSLMYMMIGVIMPALGVTLLIILFTFPMVGEAIQKMPALTTASDFLQAILPAETYAEGDYIGGLGGKQQFSGETLRLKVDELEGKKGVFSLVDPGGKVLQIESVYGAGSNLREYYTTSTGTTLFGESLKIKYIGKNIFGQEVVEVTRLEPTHLVFWALLAMVAVMEFMYIGIIKSRRPSIIG